MVDDIMSSTGRLGLMPEDKSRSQEVVRFIGSYNLFDKVEKVQDEARNLPKEISTALAKEIVDFMENYDRAFGYSDEIEGQRNKEEWIQTVKNAFVQGEGKVYIETVSRLREETARAVKQAARIEKALMICGEERGSKQVLINEEVEEIEEIFER